MKQLKQLSLFVENRPGALSEVCRVLKNAGVNIYAMSVADTSEFGILRLLLDNIELGNKALSEAGFVTRETNVLAISVPDCAGGLSGVFEITDKLGLSVEYMYAITFGRKDNAVIVFRFDDQQTAGERLAACGVELLSAADIAAGK